MLKQILMLGVPWLAARLDTKKTYIFSILLGGAALLFAACGMVSIPAAILAVLSAGTLSALREGFAKVEPYIPIADKFLEHFGYADLDVVFAKLKAQLPKE